MQQRHLSKKEQKQIYIVSVHYKGHPYTVSLSSLQVSTTKLVFSSSSLLVLPGKAAVVVH